MNESSAMLPLVQSTRLLVIFTKQGIIFKPVRCSMGIMLRYFITHTCIVLTRSDLDKKIKKTASDQHL